MRSIEITQIKKAMKQLLLGNRFDNFLLVEASITTFNTFHIDGTLHPEFYREEGIELKDFRYSSWKIIKPICYELIKGKHQPLKFKIVFCLKKEDIRKLLTKYGYEKEADDLDSLSFVIQYDKNPEFSGEDAGDSPRMMCITGMSRKTFNMDRSLESFWDDLMEKFIHSLEED